MPVVPDELRESIRQALDAENWKNGIEVISALPGWITLRVACRRMTADRMTRYITELAGGVPNLDRTELATAFREVLLNAMEHGAGFDPDKVIEVAAVRTARTIVYYFKDPGPGFNPKAPGLVATDDDPLTHLTHREAEGKRPGGFGMLLTAKLVDEVHYNERGNEVILVKHLDTLNGKEAHRAAGHRQEARATIQRRQKAEGVRATEGTESAEPLCVNAIMTAVLVVTGATVFAGEPGARITGQYVEARTAEVFAGGCIMNSEAETMGRQAIMAWKITAGSFDGRDARRADGRGRVAGDRNLGMREMGGEEPTAVKAIITVDPGPRRRSAMRWCVRARDCRAG